ncbi:MAG: YceD family protein [Flavobacteriales bacterium]
MKPLREYRIPFLGLKPGHHEYEFQMTDTFFDEFENSEIDHADIKVDLILEKQTNMMILQFDLSGEILSACDRCGDDLNLPIHASEKLVVKLGDQTSPTDDDVVVLGPQEFELDISQYLYEYAHLALPFRHVHQNTADCNQEVLKALEKYRVDKTSNTQWADLKNLNYEDPEDQEFFNEEEE